MTIPGAYADRSVYHFTPVANLPAILEHGLLSITEQAGMGLPLRTIVWDAVQRHRASVTIPVGQRGTPEEYIPFYFSKLSPMLLMVMSSKIIDEETIIHFEFPIHILDGARFVFSDAAIIPNSQPHFYTDPRDLSRLNWEAIDSPDWRMPTESLRYARMSELLIYRRLPIETATRLIVWDSAMAGQVLQLFQAAGRTSPRIETDPTCYFLASEPPLRPAISGPTLIYQAYQAAIQELATRINQAEHPRFKNLHELRTCLQAGLACLPETAELIGLETDNRAHFEDIGAHTRRVVAETIRSPEYAGLSSHDRALLEIAAYLHDIGKGPKSRWASFGGKQQLDPDHPVKALPMLRRILEEEIGAIDYPDAVLLCKLVVYHDIIGGILFSGRRIEELLGVFETAREFNMLMGLGRADSVAINPAWNHDAERAALRQAVLPLLAHDNLDRV
jgi:hypothetical protein